MKNNRSIKSRLLGFLIGTVVISLLLVLMGIGFYLLMRQEYEKSTDQMLTLNRFFTNLEGINQDVYTYTLEGDEGVYRLITDACIENRKTLSHLADMQVSKEFYRDIRDVEEMFYSYTTRIGRIYDHSYLCAEFTIGSKAVINKYYSETQEVYEAIKSEFQDLYSQLLNSISYRRLMEEKKNMVYLADMLVVVALVLLHQSHRIRDLTYRVIQPVQALTESASEMGNTDLDQVQFVEQEPDMEEEMRVLIQVYNSMITRIQTQIRTIQENASAKERLKDQELENLKIRNLLKTSELKALQMQINPHFLFNTLNMISQTAYIENSEQTVKLLDSMARLLRYTLDYTEKAVTLAREIEILGHYVELQEYRFGDRILFEFDLDEGFHQVQVPSMILQPLVENALTHGVGMKLAGARIVIRTEYEEQSGRGIIEICDNGVGMAEEQLQEVRRDMKRNNKVQNRIGLSNIYMRLQIFFNHEADMEIFSLQEEGTTVRISIPCISRGSNSGRDRNDSDNSSR